MSEFSYCPVCKHKSVYRVANTFVVNARYLCRTKGCKFSFFLNSPRREREESWKAENKKRGLLVVGTR